MLACCFGGGTRANVAMFPVHILRFTLGDARYGVAIDRVVEVAPRVVITPLPDVPDFVEGLFSYRRRACVAVSLRRRLGHPTRAPALDDHIVVVQGKRRLLGFVVDRVHGDEVIADHEIERPTEGSQQIKGVVALGDGMLLIQDVDAMLSDDDERILDQRMAGGEA